MTISVLINGNPAVIRAGSFSISDGLEEASKCSFTILNTTSLDSYTKGMPVMVYNDGALEFAGFIDTCDVEKRENAWLHSIRCVDNHYLATKRIIAETYKNTLSGDVLIDIIPKYLSAEGVKGTRVQPTFDRGGSAYLQNGSPVGANLARIETMPGQSLKGVLVEESTTNKVINPFFQGTYSSGLAPNWTKNGIPTVSENADLRYCVYGLKSQHIQATGASQGIWQTHSAMGLTTGQQYTVTALLYLVSGQVTLSVEGNGLVITSLAGATGLTTLSGTFTYSSTSGAITLYSVGAADFYTVALQVENKGYATTFIDSSRSAETFTIPTDSVINLQEGTIEFLLFMKNTVKNTGADRYVLAHSTSSNSPYPNSLCLYHGTDNKWHFVTRDNSGNVTDINVADTLGSGTLHRFAIRWNETEAAMFINGQKYTAASPFLPTALASSLTIGSWISGTSGHCNTWIGDVVVSNRWRSDTELYSRSGLAQLVPDPGTTYYLPFTGSLTATTTIDAGALVIEKRFRYISSSKAIESLAEGSEYTWFIDPSRWLHFKPRDAYPAPWAITSDDVLKNSESFGSEAPDYRNRQYVLGVKQLTSLQNEAKKGDGNETTWTVGYPVAMTPTITVNGVSKTVGIRGSDGGKDYYWSRGENTITQDSSGTVLTSTDILRVQYQGMYDIVLMGENPAAIQDRKSVEGGTGYVDDVMTSTLTTDTIASLDIANSKLSKYGVVSRRFKFATNKPGLEPGQIAEINIPEHALTGNMLVERVDTKTSGKTLIYDITIVDGPVVGSWSKSMSEMGRDKTISDDANDSESVIILVSNTETMTVNGNITVTVNACPLPDPATYPNTTLYPC